jgi:serine/threonine protein kinase
LKRNVAIKVLDPDYATNPYWIRRFREEAETTANLEHPSIVTIYEIHQQENLHYCVMQYLPQGLVSILKQKKRALSSAEAIQILEPIAEALAFVHKKGVVHRDIKPANILVDEHGSPILTDFGIAVRDDSTRFEGHATTGTAEYMSPEQIRGETNIDGRSDVYSLGVVLYELLTGNVPYHSEDPQAVFYQQVHEPVPEKPLKDHQVPKRVKEIVSRCLEKAARDRYQSADALVEAFNDLLRNPPTMRSFRPKRNFPFAVVLVPVLLFVGAAVLYAMIFSGVGFERNPRPFSVMGGWFKHLRGPVVQRHHVASPFASAAIFLDDSIQNQPVPFAAKLVLSAVGCEESLEIPDGRAAVYFWPDTSQVEAEPRAGTSDAGVINLRCPIRDSTLTLQVSATVPYYMPKSETFRLSRGKGDSIRLDLRPRARICGGCGKVFGIKDTICDSCGRLRTKWAPKE